MDICIFCSGTYNRKSEKEIDVNQIKKTFDTNFLVLFIALKKWKIFLKKKKGHISIVSSIAGYRGLPNSSGYGPSKVTLTNFTESIYFDFKKFNVSFQLFHQVLSKLL